MRLCQDYTRTHSNQEYVHTRNTAVRLIAHTSRIHQVDSYSVKLLLLLYTCVPEVHRPCLSTASYNNIRYVRYKFLILLCIDRCPCLCSSLPIFYLVVVYFFGIAPYFLAVLKKMLEKKCQQETLKFSLIRFTGN